MIGKVVEKIRKALESKGKSGNGARRLENGKDIANPVPGIINDRSLVV